MARFYLKVKGARGEGASRTGTVESGASAVINGWHIGLRVECSVDENGDDQIDVYSTGGSHKRVSERLIATLKDLELATSVEVFPPLAACPPSEGFGSGN